VTGPGASSDLTVDGVRRGEEFDLILPNFATAGFQWRPAFDEAGFALVGAERRAGSPGQIAFRFRALGSAGKIQFVLARPGRPPHETRTYNIAVVEP
jgi:predicted secreted protein